MSKITETQHRTVLSLRQNKFVDSYLKTANCATAAVAAGYKPAQGPRVLKHPAVAAAVQASQQKLRAETEYTTVEAMRECEEGMDFARRTNNAMALAKMIELRTKLMGLLIEKLDVRQMTNFRINILGMPSPSNSEVALPALAANVPLPLNPNRETADDEEDIFGV